MPEEIRELRVVDASGNAIFRVDKVGKVRLEEFIIANSRSKELFHVDKDGKLILKELIVMNNSGKILFHVDKNGIVKIGASETEGKLEIKNKSGKLYAAFQPAMLMLYDPELPVSKGSINLNAQSHSIVLYNKEGTKKTIHLDGQNGDIILHNGDCAEDFIVADDENLEPGSVVVISEDGKLRQSTQAYDKRVAGIISGAGDCRPGIILGRKPSNEITTPIALTGKVFCKATADKASIHVGDLLTTSNIPGFAMKATDSTIAFGAVIGKALEHLESGQGLIPILVALQ